MSQIRAIQGQGPVPSSSTSSEVDQDVQALRAGKVTVVRVREVAKRHGISPGELFNQYPELLTALLNDDSDSSLEALKLRQESHNLLMGALKESLKSRIEAFERCYEDFERRRMANPGLLSPAQAPPPIPQGAEPLELKDRLPKTIPV